MADHVCKKCKWVWMGRTRGKPKECPHCKSYNWDKPVKTLAKKIEVKN